MKTPNATEVEVFRLRQRNKELNEKVAELQKYIQEMVAKAADAHRPAYDEQQRVIMELHDRIKELESELARADYATRRAVERAETAEKPKPKKLKTKKPKA